MTIQAIETQYKGYRFRSRLEARWAVFFDALGAAWEYEPEGFDLGNDLYYLPDFFLPFPSPVLVGKESQHIAWNGYRGTQAYWVEIKPINPTRLEMDKMLLLASQTKHHVYCFAGEPWPEKLEVFLATVQGHWSSRTAFARRQELEMIELRASVGCDSQPISEEYVNATALYGFCLNLLNDWHGLTSAFVAARSARFEHGQSGGAVR